MSQAAQLQVVEAAASSLEAATPVIMTGEGRALRLSLA
jgi:hypothetical protein